MSARQDKTRQDNERSRTQALSINQSIIYLPEKNYTSRTQRLQNNTNKCPKTQKINYIECSFWKAYV